MSTFVRGGGGATENLEAPLTELESTLQEILEVLPFKGFQNSGQYVWKKCIAPQYPPLTFKLISSANGVSTIQVSSNIVDLSTKDSSFFVGYSGNLPSGSNPHTVTFTSSNSVHIVYSASSKLDVAFTYNPLTAQIVINNAWAGTPSDVFSKGEDSVFETVSYLVSDNAETYPDCSLGDDGFWYELVQAGVDLSVVGLSQVAVDVFTPSSTIPMTTAVSHSLGVMPRAALLLNMTYPLNNSNGYEAFSSFVALFRDGYRATSVFRSGTDFMFEFVAASTNIATPTATAITLGSSSTAQLYAGSTYKLITWA